MNIQTVQFANPILLDMYKGATDEELKWTLSYIQELLTSRQIQSKATKEQDNQVQVSPRIQKLLLLQKRNHVAEDGDDIRLQNILSR